ncbi:hypothetical protein [Burkholderia cepacia]|uniref:hypothetical protein n=1 Tax=Burkholderia cepacia TaxID=292 RepID=UPI001CF14038|nr:hypothetical protein [Burkholderia cepacia]MCA8110286.1 hypothetical protein [Burkholderia cepacia]MCA8396585.1 hypothetical protein [Burkholderia cepacia]
MNTLPIPLTSAVVLRGQRAWGRIKATAAEQRQLWKEVGEALMVGRKLNSADRAFKQWCDEHGFGDMARCDRADAMWLAVYDGPTPEGLTHPTRIRQWHREQASETPPAPEVDLSSSPAPRPRLTIETAKKVNKLTAMSQSGEGQEQETAKKYLKKQAEKFGMKPEELSELAGKTDPMRGISPDEIETRKTNVAAMERQVKVIGLALKALQADDPETPFTREMAIAILDQVCDALGVI